jgi:hypothetical protein
VDKPTAAILLTLVAHLFGIGALMWLAFDGSRFDWRSWWPSDEDGGDDGGDVPAGPPLPDAGPSGRRVRTEHDRPPRRRVRRPQHAPDPARTREPI